MRESARHTAGVAQLVERKPSKLDVAGSSPVSRFGCQVELVERDWWSGTFGGLLA